jgi:glycosyltransferase involved in cell wall biosynthesis
MRVARVSHSGVVSAWRQRERELTALGVEIQMVCAAQWVEGGGIVELTGSDAARDGFVEPARTVGSHPNLFLFDPRPLWKLLGDPTVDLVDIHEEPFSLVMAEVLLLKLLRRNTAPYVVYSAQNLDKDYPPPFRWIERYALRRAAGAYVCNDEAGRRLRRKGLVGELAVIALGVDLDRFHPAAGSDVPAAPRQAVRVGYVGRLACHKGVHIAMEALAPLEGWTLEIVGDGPDRTELLQRAAALGMSSRVVVHGHADQDGLAEHYRSFDVLVVPSIPTPSWTEQFGRVVVEAMASGVPVVASDAGALPEVVSDAGVVVPAGDSDALREALLDIARNPVRWSEIRDAGFARAAQYSWASVAIRQLELYAHVTR